mgnify:CR=1 FL=1
MMESPPLPTISCRTTDALVDNRGDTDRFRDVGGYDRTYHLHRIMMATAMSDGQSDRAVDMDQASWVEKYNVGRPYTQEEVNMMKSAFNTIDSDYKFLEQDLRSMEEDEVQRVSPIAKPKKNKYGV